MSEAEEQKVQKPFFTKIALEKLTEFEENKLHGYWDNIGRVWTIGRGHTGPINLPDLKRDHWDSYVQITEEQSIALCQQDISHCLETVLDVTYSESDNFRNVTNNQFSALVIFAYNVGAHAFENSTLAEYLSDAATPSYDEVKKELMRWVKAKGVVINGLVNRRKKELELWNTPDDPSDVTGAFS